MTHELSSGNAGQDSTDERSVGPRRVQSPEVEQLRTLDVDASKFEVRGYPVVEGTMKRRQPRLPRRVNRPIDERDKVDVADARRVVACRHRSPNEQIGDPTQRREPVSQLLDDRWDGGHERILPRPNMHERVRSWFTCLPAYAHIARDTTATYA